MRIEERGGIGDHDGSLDGRNSERDLVIERHLGANLD